MGLCFPSRFHGTRLNKLAGVAQRAKYIHRNNAVQIKVQSKFLEAIKVAKTAASN